MRRQFYLDLAASGIHMPIGTHLVPYEQSDPSVVAQDGERLGRVVEEVLDGFRK
jgi:hypothetical protein